MRGFCLFSLTVLAASLPAQKDGPIQLTEPKSGVTVTLPKDWKFAAGQKGLVAVDAKDTAMVVLAACKQDFGGSHPDVEKSISASKLHDVEIDRTTVIAERDRGALTGLISVSGSGVDEKGDDVTFSACIVKSGDDAGLVLGAWKNPGAASAVSSILDDVCIRQPSSKDGLELCEPETGAAVTLPAGWVTVASKKGLLAWNPDRSAMAMIIRPQENFAGAVAAAKQYLKDRVFEDVSIGEFGEVEATDAVAKSDFTRVVGASGKAKDRADDKPVEFRVLALQRPDQDRSALIFGAWKDDEGEAAVQRLLDSIHVAKAAKKAQKKDTDK